MTLIPAVCKTCGLSFSANFVHIGRGAHVSFSDSKVSCPRCRSLADIQDGTYNYLGHVISAFTGATQEQLKRFQEIATAAAAGHLSEAQANRQAEIIHIGFGHVISLALQWGIPALLVAIIALYLQWQDSLESSQSSERMLSELRGIHETEIGLHHEIQKMETMQGTYVPPQYLPQKPNTTQSPAPSKTANGANRHERRKAAALAKRGKRKP